ncbi:pyridoxamine 5'-phosphate oxidase family protein [Tateyamaria omphalii]|uniref:pyridoxamine 5'-phosphate oxidase family protein n=1 Tax=Tateyamaria omphalii TaxID=299262 RepID=UPI001E3C4CEF|nr:pyridoxamine 5'-phosphate oxidase family protein [Tateyamaria omphalii]
MLYDSFEICASALPAGAKAVIDRASTVFLATKHITDDTTTGIQTDMGVNHRGGAPGFTRMYEDNDGDRVTTYLVLPDHSGNRFYQSLGNIETDPQVGLVFPDFTTGRVLYVTGDAENLLDQDAEALMPRASLLTRIKVTGAVFVKGGLNLKLTSQERFSPYNPPIKYLRRELEQMGHATVAQSNDDAITAKLVSTRALSDSIKTFNFELSKPINAPLPGGFGVFDFSDVLDVGYNHMNEANPQLINEDYVRTWTLSSAPSYDAKTNSFHAINRVSVTVKRKPGGLISNVLHNNIADLTTQKPPVEFKGTGTGFTCFSPSAAGLPPNIPSKMLWIAGGVGITPFMAMWDGIVQVANAHPEQISTKIVLLFSGRGDDINVLKHFASQSGSVPANVKLRIVALQSTGGNRSNANFARDGLRHVFSHELLRLEERRIQISDLPSAMDLKKCEVFMCGPDALMAWCEKTLTELNVEGARRHRESFIF